MIYVATVHFGSPRWIDPQLAYLRRNISEPLLVFASLEDVAGNHEDKYDRVVPSAGPHAGKLNLLAAEICAVATDNDIIVFLDGDAFPIADPMPTVRRALETTTLVAVRRDENHGDRQPHPCFCAVRVADWRRLHGDWSAGHCWTSADGGAVTDVGGNLLRALELAGDEWTPLLRSNRLDLHPLWFGIYGEVVYHHGAGFRAALSRVDLAEAPRASSLGRSLPLAGPVLRRLDTRRRQRFWETTAARAADLQEEMFRNLLNDPQFFRKLL